MYKMDQWNAPQWSDFTSSPQPLCEDYFDYEHKEHEPHLNIDCEELKVSSSTISNLNKSGIASIPVASPKQSSTKTISSKIPSKKMDMEDEVNINLKTPVTVMPLTAKHNDSIVANKTTYEDVLVDAMSNLKLLSSKRRSRRSHNVSIYKPSTSNKLRSTKSVGIRPSEDHTCKKNIMKDLGMIRPAETENISDAVDESKNHDNTEVETTTKPVKSKVISNFNKEPVVANLRKSVANPTLLTCKYRRYSLSKNRRRSNQYVSLAEAVSKFQNQTPKRFRTAIRKTMEPGPLAKTKQSLKITHPVSPILLSKSRVRSVAIGTSNQNIHGKPAVSNIVNQKNKIQVKPVPIGKATASSVLPKKKIENSVPTSNQSQMSVKKRFNKITMPIIESNASENSGFNIKNVEMSNFGVKAISMHRKSTCAVPFSFEAREKELRKKKAERLERLEVEKLEKLEAEKENRKVGITVHTGATDTKLVPKNVHVAPPMLKTDKRAKERREFDEKLRQKECQEEEKRRRLRDEQLAKEKMEKALLRKMAEPKARPMPIYKQVAILKSKKPLTAPQSPAWAAKTKH